jgi:hypothetical protein
MVFMKKNYSVRLNKWKLMQEIDEIPRELLFLNPFGDLSFSLFSSSSPILVNQ